MWALVVRSHCQCSMGEVTTGRYGRRALGAYAKLAGWSTVLEESQTASITMVVAAPEATRVAKIVHAVSLTKTKGTVFIHVHLTDRGPGAEACRPLHAEYAGSSGATIGTSARENNGWQMRVLVKTS